MFKDRYAAGQKLADRLLKYRESQPIILALPRGGVPVGFEIARRLNVPLGVWVVRKLGAPHQKELGIGAMAEGDVVIWDHRLVSQLGISAKQLEKIKQSETQELQRRIQTYRGSTPQPQPTGKTIILVDDGLATGITVKAAFIAILRHDPARLIVAVPVCAHDAFEDVRRTLRPGRDEIICLLTPEGFVSVGRWYRRFEPVSDQIAIELLSKP